MKWGGGRKEKREGVGEREGKGEMWREDIDREEEE